MQRGRFITLEGGEGAGKSTQLTRLAAFLDARGRRVLTTREPGGTAGAEEIRSLLVNGEPGRWDAWSEALLVYAARLDHVTRKIEPALAAGTWVLCDRFVDSTIAYQGEARGLGHGAIEALHGLTLGRLWPDLTLILDLPVEQGLARAAGRQGGEGRFEGFDRAFHEQLHQAFRAIAAREPERCRLIDASGDEAGVATVIAEAVAARFGLDLAAAAP